MDNDPGAARRMRFPFVGVASARAYARANPACSVTNGLSHRSVDSVARMGGNDYDAPPTRPPSHPMRPIALAFLALALHATNAVAAKPVPAAKAARTATPFPGLAVLDLKNEGVRIRYPADKAQKSDHRAAYLANYEEAGVHASQPLRFDFGHGLPTATLTCDSGPSNDPMCRLLTDAEQPSSTIFEAPGKEFVFLANGDIYVFGQSDSMYDHRRLFRHDGQRYVEAAQPLRYVGIDGITRAPLALTATRGGDAAHALRTLDAGTPVTILLNAADGDDENGLNPDFLLKTREGLVGWASIPSKPDGTTIVEGLRFNGD